MPLVIAGIVQDREYFERFVEPHVDGTRVRYIGPVTSDRRVDLLGGARALLHLVNFDEPFGFSVVEAMACGTPVIAHCTRIDARDRQPRRERLPRHLAGRSGGSGACVRSARRGRGAQVGRATVRRRPDGGRLHDRLSRGRGAASTKARTRAKHPLMAPQSFRLGVNYWPARTAMRWWADFDQAEVAADFERIAAAGLDSVRLFLLWEDFQPAPDEVDRQMLGRLVTVADLAARAGLAIVPTLFTGHMSGVNWIPAWALGGIGRRRPLPGGVRRQCHRCRPAQLVLGPGCRPRASAPRGGGGCGPGGPRGALGVGSRQRELELRRAAGPGRLRCVGWIESPRRSARPTRRR